MLRAAALALLVASAGADGASAGAERLRKPDVSIGRICDLIHGHARLNGLSPDWLARLIWKESSFDIEQAIPASAAYLAELRTRFGNLGLAAAAYNSGEGRVSRWLARGGFLPLETENYVIDIMGEPAEVFVDKSYAGTVHPLSEGAPFTKACRELPVTLAATIPMARIPLKPWGVQVAGNFRRAVAIRQYQQVRARFPKLLRGHEPVVSRIRSPTGWRGIYAVRIGADSRPDAEIICRQLRAAGGACVVLKNR